MTMIERMARAIADADQEDYMEDCIIYDKRATAALAALREPTQAMLDSAAWRDGKQTARTVWRDMIDAALSDDAGSAPVMLEPDEDMEDGDPT